MFKKRSSKQPACLFYVVTVYGKDYTNRDIFTQRVKKTRVFNYNGINYKRMKRIILKVDISGL